MFQRSHTLWYFIENTKHFLKFFFLQISCKDLLFLCTSIIIMFFPCFFCRLFPYREWMERIFYKLYSSKPLKALAPRLCPTLRPHGLTTARQALPSIGFSRQEYWSGLPFPSPGDLPDPGIEHGSPTLQAVFDHLSHLQHLPTSCSTYCTCFSATLNQPSLSFPSPCPQVCSLCLHLYSWPTNMVISITFLDSIYRHWYILFLFLWLILFGITCSRFIHLSSTDSNPFLFMESNISLYTCTTESLSIHLIDKHTSSFWFKLWAVLWIDLYIHWWDYKRLMSFHWLCDCGTKIAQPYHSQNIINIWKNKISIMPG